jgi:hypothetical protein
MVWSELVIHSISAREASRSRALDAMGAHTTHNDTTITITIGTAAKNTDLIIRSAARLKRRVWRPRRNRLTET